MATSGLDSDIAQLVEAVQLLASDVVLAGQLSGVKDTQFARRAYVRAAFALVEGNLNLMADVILRTSDRGEIQLSLDETQVLRQKRASIDKNGMQIVSVKFVPIRDRIGPVFEMFARQFGKMFRLDKNGSGWVAFHEAIEIRNRITHPRNAQSFKIEDADLNSVERARAWFANSVKALLDEVDDRDGGSAGGPPIPSPTILP